MVAMTDVERRKFFRIEVVAPIRFRLIEETTSKPLTDWMNGSTVDVSLGGVKVTAPMPEAQVEMLVDRYVLIEFSCQLPGTPTGIAATATVAYFLRGVTVSKAPTATFGLSFVSIDNSAKDIIAEFIRLHINFPACP
jgi:c-di-GMP-binding flagellar brake protein YcgR